MTLGELIGTLERLDPALLIDGRDLDSYRGYYDQIAVTPGHSTVGAVLERCREALAGETFQGYKGGEYTMDEHTAVWYAEYGHTSGLGVVGVTVGGSRARFHVVDVSAYG